MSKEKKDAGHFLNIVLNAVVQDKTCFLFRSYNNIECWVFHRVLHFKISNEKESLFMDVK